MPDFAFLKKEWAGNTEMLSVIFFVVDVVDGLN
jgi:hypothetical protein